MTRGSDNARTLGGATPSRSTQVSRVDSRDPFTAGERRSGMGRSLVLLLLPLLFAAGCAPGERPGPPPVEAVPAHPRDAYGASEIVLRIGGHGGFVAPEMVATRLPEVTVYGDGRVITDRSGLTVRTISADAVQRLVTLAIAAGVGGGADYGRPSIFDSPSTYFTVETDAGRLQSSVEGLTISDGLSASQLAARAPLADLRNRVVDLGATLGDDAGPETAYQPTAVAAVSRPWGEVAAQQPERAWPGPALPGQPLPVIALRGPDDLSCVDVTGADVPTALAEAGVASEGTPWTWAGARYRVWLRPLLPEERGCRDLAIAPLVSYRPGDLVLRIASEPGPEVLPPYGATYLPAVSVFGDGRVITHDPRAHADARPALPAVQVRLVSQRAVQEIVQIALDAGLGQRDHYPVPLLMDANTTRFTALTNRGRLTTSVYGLGANAGTMPPDEQVQRQRLADLRDALLDVTATLGSIDTGPAQPYQPVALAAVVWAHGAADAGAQRAWPGPPLPQDLPYSANPHSRTIRCVTVTGTELSSLLAEAGTAHESTPWTWNGRTYGALLRPLLPDESSCADL